MLWVVTTRLVTEENLCLIDHYKQTKSFISVTHASQ
jgi:hypothetical protein